MKSTKEKYFWDKYGNIQKSYSLKLGSHSSYQLINSPRRIIFSLSRYKFAAKMIGDGKNILELGSSDGLGLYILSEFANKATGVDFDDEVINFAKKNIKKNNVNFLCDDFLGKKYGLFDAVVSFDVIEHIDRKNEKIFLNTICDNLVFNGICIIGTPNIKAKKYSSKIVNDAHINLYSALRLKKLMGRYFNNVFIFGANDEIIHTGFYSMSQYLIVMGCHKK